MGILLLTSTVPTQRLFSKEKGSRGHFMRPGPCLSEIKRIFFRGDSFSVFLAR